jgi:hypothetical protein
MLEKCGTYAGYNQHTRDKTPRCEACKAAGREYAAQWRSNMPESSKQKNREAQARYRSLNPDKNAARISLFKELNPEKSGKYAAAWRSANLERARELGRLQEHKRRAFKMNGVHNPYSEDEVIERYGKDCHICKGEVELSAPRQVGVDGWEFGLHLDHLLPLSKGGTDSIENVRPAHGLCNLQKSSKVWEEVNE